MKKVLVILVLLGLVGFGIYKNVQNQRIKAEREQAKVEKQMKKVDFHNYPVKNDPKQIQKQPQAVAETTTATRTTTQTNSFSGINFSLDKKNIPGDEIPKWVYKNTSSLDDYNNLINSRTNFVFTSYADCPIGNARKTMVDNAIRKSGTSGKFLNKTELVPQGKTVIGTCRKIYQGNNCYVQSNKIEEGTCKCAIHYLLDNCRSQFCIINPTQRRIVFVQPDEAALTVKLNELKNSW